MNDSHTRPRAADASAPLLTLDGVGVRRDGRWLVRGVDLTVRPGEIVTLIGPNGSGKSTTARAALGIMAADEGRIYRRPALRVGYVPQLWRADGSIPLTVARFISLVHPVAVSEARAALARTGVAHLEHAQMQELSGGERQRVLLARALAGRPDLLVLDEPVQGVDVNGEVALYELIASARRDIGCGILLVSHDLHVVMAATDHVLCLNGHVCCQGTPVAVSGNPAYRELFGDRGASALALYEHRHDHQHLPDGRVRHADGTITDHCHAEDGHHHHHEHAHVAVPGEAHDAGRHP
ncbi:MAG: ATP-binding cassette domain-containing protein [Burkholderiaceae bacterium]